MTLDGHSRVKVLPYAGLKLSPVVGGSARPNDFELQQDSVLSSGITAGDLMAPVRAAVFQLVAEGTPSNMAAAYLTSLASELFLGTVNFNAADHRTGRSAIPQSPASPPPFLFRRAGEFWDLGFQSGGIFHLKDRRGLSDIARREISAWELCSAAGEGSMRSATHDDDLRIDDGRGVPVADEKTIRAVRNVLKEMPEKIAAAREEGALDKLEKLQEEIDEYESYVRSNTDKFGRPRLTSGAAGKARVAVKNRIMRAIEAIEKNSPAMAHHLDRSIRTGTMVVYQPETQVPWEF